MNTKEQIQEYLDRLDDGEPVLFALLHPDDRKYVDRSFDNKAGTILEHPAVYLKAVGTGRLGTRKTGPENHSILLMPQ
jgi:hypothetical protein